MKNKISLFAAVAVAALFSVSCEKNKGDSIDLNPALLDGFWQASAKLVDEVADNDYYYEPSLFFDSGKNEGIIYPAYDPSQTFHNSVDGKELSLTYEAYTGKSVVDRLDNNVLVLKWSEEGHQIETRFINMSRVFVGKWEITWRMPSPQGEVTQTYTFNADGTGNYGSYSLTWGMGEINYYNCFRLAIDIPDMNYKNSFRVFWPSVNKMEGEDDAEYDVIMERVME